MKASVIFTTYNHPKWLEKTLWGFCTQTFKDFEIIVADDGSESKTLQVIERIKEGTDLNITHIWHEDDGFQKCQILNKAIEASNSEYLIFTDGDCIPTPHFVENHLRLSEKRRFISGGYFKLPLDLSRQITKEDILSLNAVKPGWLLKNGLKFTHRLMKLASNDSLARIFDLITTTRATWNGHSSSTFKEYIIAANGFDERMQYGGQDRELGERLENMGIKGKQGRHRTCVVHLDHARGYAHQESIDINKKIRKWTRDNRITRTDYGIKKDRTA